jgi:hypothetical protein
MHEHVTAMPKRRRLWDGLGILVSSVCLVHCLAPALLAGTFVFMGGGGHSEHATTHAWFFVVAAATGLLAFLPGFRHHRSWKAPLLATAGFVSLGFGAFAAHDIVGHEGELVFTVLGGLLLLGAHVLNIIHCRRGHPCASNQAG